MLAIGLRRALLIVLIAVCGAGPALARVHRVLEFSANPVAAGQESRLTLYLTNEGPSDETVPVRATVKAEILANGVVWPVTLTLIAPETAKDTNIASGQFLRLTYGFTVPAAVSGPVALRLSESPDTSGLMIVERAQPAAGQPEEVASAGERPKQSPHIENPVGTDEPGHGNAFLKNLSVYKPIYFLFGPSPLDAKFQLSFKYRLFSGSAGLAKRWPVLKGLYFAYTQKSFWDLHSPSKPFTDSSFSPELFYRTHLTSARPQTGRRRCRFADGHVP